MAKLRDESETTSQSLIHGIPRAEWVRRFKAAIIARADLADSAHADEIANAELDSYPEKDDPQVVGFDSDWLIELPEDAADECLSNWTD